MSQNRARIFWGALLFLASGAAAQNTGTLTTHTVPAVSAGSGTTELIVSQTAHGFTANQWLMHSDSTDSWELLDTDTLAIEHNAIAFVKSVEGVNSFTATVGGVAIWTAHGLDLGPIFASTTAGSPTATAPNLGEREWLLGVASDANTVILMQRDWSQL